MAQHLPRYKKLFSLKFLIGFLKIILIAKIVYLENFRGELCLAVEVEHLRRENAKPTKLKVKLPTDVNNFEIERTHYIQTYNA